MEIGRNVEHGTLFDVCPFISSTPTFLILQRMLLEKSAMDVAPLASYSFAAMSSLEVGNFNQQKHAHFLFDEYVPLGPEGTPRDNEVPQSYVWNIIYSYVI